MLRESAAQKIILFVQVDYTCDKNVFTKYNLCTHKKWFCPIVYTGLRHKYNPIFQVPHRRIELFVEKGTYMKKQLFPACF